MKLSLTTQKGDFYSLDLDSSMEIENVKALVEAECGIPPEAQTLLHNGQPLADLKKTLADYNVREHDIILVVANQTSAQQPIRSVQQQRGQFGTSPLANDWVEQLRQQMLSDPQLQRQISVQNPALLAAAQSADPSQFRRLIEQVAAQQRQQQLTQRQELERLHADPFDVESQQKIAEMIRMQRVQENMEAAMEHNPEAFGRVIMLYIDCEVNGHKVKAFVDSGAQATILSPDCAEACELMGLLDTRFAGTAVGVGTAKILGRVHAATMKLGTDPNPSKNLFLQCSFTVMEGKGVDLLFGLDMLKRFQACVDLHKNVLRIGEFETPFLAEKDLPDKAKQQEQQPFEQSDKQHAAAAAASPTGKQQLASSSSSSTTTTTTTTASAAPSQATKPGNATSNRSNGGFPEQDIEKLTSLGASREQAIRFLQMSNGNVDLAASLIFDS